MIFVCFSSVPLPRDALFYREERKLVVDRAMEVGFYVVLTCKLCKDNDANKINIIDTRHLANFIIIISNVQVVTSAFLQELKDWNNVKKYS